MGRIASCCLSILGLLASVTSQSGVLPSRIPSDMREWEAVLGEKDPRIVFQKTKTRLVIHNKAPTVVWAAVRSRGFTTIPRLKDPGPPSVWMQMRVGGSPKAVGRFGLTNGKQQDYAQHEEGRRTLYYSTWTWGWPGPIHVWWFVQIPPKSIVWCSDPLVWENYGAHLAVRRWVSGRAGIYWNPSAWDLGMARYRVVFWRREKPVRTFKVPGWFGWEMMVPELVMLVPDISFPMTIPDSLRLSGWWQCLSFGGFNVQKSVGMPFRLL